jgi:hypothetical protein
MADQRPQKTWRMSYWVGGEDKIESAISILGNPGEVRASVGQKSFISVHEDKISMSGGTPSVISIQGMSSSMKYAGMIQDLPWPLTMIPSTTYTAMPMQLIIPPFVEQLPTIVSTAALLVGLI